MKITHNAVKSPVFELVKTLVIDLEVADYSFEIRLELFRDTERSNYFRCHLWELESFHIEDAASMAMSGRPKDISDDLLPKERASRLKGDYGHFKAANEKAALKVVLNDLLERLEHWTQQKARLEFR
jgi:hypothetical protein